MPHEVIVIIGVTATFAFFSAVAGGIVAGLIVRRVRA